MTTRRLFSFKPYILCKSLSDLPAAWRHHRIRLKCINFGVAYGAPLERAVEMTRVGKGSLTGRTANVEGLDKKLHSPEYFAAKNCNFAAIPPRASDSTKYAAIEMDFADLEFRIAGRNFLIQMEQADKIANQMGFRDQEVVIDVRPARHESLPFWFLKLQMVAQTTFKYPAEVVDEMQIENWEEYYLMGLDAREALELHSRRALSPLIGAKAG